MGNTSKNRKHLSWEAKKQEFKVKNSVCVCVCVCVCKCGNVGGSISSQKIRFDCEQTAKQQEIIG